MTRYNIIVKSISCIVIAVLILFLLTGLLTQKKRLSRKAHSRLWENIRLVLGIMGSLLLFSVDIAAMISLDYSLVGAIKSLSLCG